MARSAHGEPAANSALREFLTVQQVEPAPVRWAVLGAAGVGAVGAIVGLIVGLFVYVPTALFAMFEVGLPAAIVGGLLGLLVGTLVTMARRVSR